MKRSKKVSHKDCEHTRLIRIKHWWFKLGCPSCGKRFRKPPYKDYVTFDN